MAESVKVIVRCRPMNQREKDLNCKCVVFMDVSNCTCSIVNPCDSSAPPKSFAFDGVYHVNSTTEQIYNEIAYPLVEGVLEGYNGTVFAYGQTGCGKSFTMQGVADPASPQRGIIPRAFEHIFEAVSVAEDRKYLVLASYLEIYNEEIRDLLGRDVKRKLDLKENVDKGVYVQELSQHPVQNVSDCEALMQKGWKNRATGATLMNADSSRSHSIFSISVEMISCDSGEEHIRCGKLNLVDLAGSERQAKTGATGERLREATKINLSLSALGNVISALVDGKSRHIPYRDSKLTRLLQDSLGGNTKTLMVACLSPADNNYDETLSTLRYANRAKNIQNKPRINEDPKDTMLREYQEEIKKLRELLEMNNTDVVMVNLEEEKDKVRKQYEAEMESMRQQYMAEQDSKTKLQNDMEALRKHYEEEMLRINSQVMRTTAEVDATAVTAINSNCVTNEAPCDDGELQEKRTALKQSQGEVLLRLKKLQESMVGGERANDKELKERRLRRKKAAERRLQALAEALSHVEDDDGVFLQVYDDIQQELHQKTEALRKARVKMKAQEREILDLQTEFETERKDYLETIRRQNKEFKLLQQILDKLQPTIKRECNYSNLDKIKSEAVWNDEIERWKLPDLVISRTKLPPAVGSQLAVLRPSSAHQNGSTSPNNSHMNKSNSSPPDYQRTSPQHCPDSDEDTRAIYKKLQQSEMEDIAGNYFKPKRAAELLSRAKEDASRAFSTWKEYAARKAGVSSSVSNLLNASLSNGHNTFYSSLNALNLNSSLNANGFLNNSWGSSSAPQQNNNGWIGNNLSPEHVGTSRKPMRLEALPTVPQRQLHKNLNTMDVI